MRVVASVFVFCCLLIVACKSQAPLNSKLRDATLIDKETLPPVKFAFWADKDWVYRGYCSWSSAPYDRSSCTENVVKLPVKQFFNYFQKLEIMSDGYEPASPGMTAEQKKVAAQELLTALQSRQDLAWLPMQRRIPEEFRSQIKLSNDALVLATRINQGFLGMGDSRAVMPPFLASIYELAGRGAMKIGIRNGIKKGQSIVVSDGKLIREAQGFLDLYNETPAENGARRPVCQLFNSGQQPLPAKTVLLVSGWDRQNPLHKEITAFRLYKDAQLTQETGYMSCVGAFSEYQGSPTASFPLGELLSTFKNESDFILQGYME